MLNLLTVGLIMAIVIAISVYLGLLIVDKLAERFPKLADWIYEDEEENL